MVGNGFNNHPVGHNGFVDQLLVGYINKHHNRRINNGNQLPHHQVFAALGNAGVKGNVIFNIPVSVMNLLLHPLAQTAQPLDIFLSGIPGCHFRNPRLQKQTNVHKIQCQGIFIPHGAQPQRVRQPLGGGHHISPRPPAHLHNALAGQQLHRLPNGTASNTKPLPQFKLIGQLGPRRKGGVQNIVINLILHLLRQQLTFQM